MAPSLPLPAAISSSYKAYKQNCALVLRWIITTASDLRHSKNDENNNSEITTTSSPRPKKTGKKARGKPAKIKYRDEDSPVITLSQFRRLAAEIAAAGAAVPASILARILAVVRQRKATAAFYSSDADAWKSNKSHRFVIDAYNDVFEVLGGREWLETGEHGDAKTDGLRRLLKAAELLGPDQEDAALVDAISKLSMETQEDADSGGGGGGGGSDGEPVINEWLRDIPGLNPNKEKKPASSPASSKKGTRGHPLHLYRLVEDGRGPRTKSEQKNEHDDTASYAALCMFRDIARIRQFCSDTWRNVVPAGLLSRLTASFVTNQAVATVNQMEYDFRADFPQFKSTMDIYTVLLDRIPEDITPRQLDFIKDQMLVYMLELVDGFGDVLVDGQAPVAKDGFFGYFNPRLNRAEMSPAERYAEDQCVLLNYLPDLVAVHMLFPNDSLYSGTRKDKTLFFGDYGLVREMRRFVKDRSRPKSITLVFCCQMLLESVYARRLHLREDVYAMRNLAWRIGSEFDQLLDENFQYDPNTMRGIEDHLQAWKGVLISHMGRDELTAYKLKAGWGRLSKDAVQQDSLWRMNPWLCANAMAYATLEHAHIATNFISGAGFVASALHLWNLLQRTGHLSSNQQQQKPPILLFDALVHVFGQQVFCGDPPAEKFLNRYCLMLGVKAEAFAATASRRKHKSDATAADGSFLGLGGSSGARAGSGAGGGGKKKVASHQGGRGLTIDNASEIYKLLAADFATPSPEQCEKLRQKLQQARTSKENLQLHKDDDKDDDDMSSPLSLTVQLVENELGRQAGATPVANLNLFKVHRLCLSLFHELDEMLRPLLLAQYALKDEDLGQPFQRPFLTGWILFSVEACEKRDGSSGLGGLGGLGGLALLTLAANVVDKVVGKEMVKNYLLEGI